MADYVKSCPIDNVFLHAERQAGRLDWRTVDHNLR
jgi:hypothetical protein